MMKYSNENSSNNRINSRKANRFHKQIGLFFLILAMLFTMSGCGEAEETTAITPESLVEAIPEDDETVVERSVASVETNGDDTEDISSTEAKPISLSALEALADTENLTEEKRTELLVQSLEDAGKDSTIAKGKIKTKKLSFEVPEEFAPHEKNKNMYVTRRYSLDLSNIYYEEREVDYLMQLMTEDTYKEMALQDLKDTYGMEFDLKIDSFKETKISGIPSFIVESHFEIEGINIKQSTYIVNADKTYILVYTLTNEYDHDEEFEASKQTIQVER